MRPIDRTISVPFYLQIYGHIAEDIKVGLYRDGDRLPSIRACARILGVSNTTVEYAYQKLVAEGFATARRGSGFVVCPMDEVADRPPERFSTRYHQALGELAGAGADQVDRPAPRFDFRPDTLDQALFPSAVLARIARDVFFSEGSEQARQRTDQRGLLALRQQIARYVGAEHGVPCTPEQVLVMPTTYDLVASVAGLIDANSHSVAMEEPVCIEGARAFEDRGFRVNPVPAWPEPAWDDVGESAQGSKLLYVAPASQLSTARSMPLETRQNLVNWAQADDGYLFDDERGWEFLSGAERISSLAALDYEGRVITLGTFSDALSPAFGVSYAILPPQLMLRWLEANDIAHCLVPWHTQAMLAAFMADGHWIAHLRKMSTAMARRRDLLLKALDGEFAGEIDVVSGSGNLHVLVRPHSDRPVPELVDGACRHDVGVYPTRCFWQDRAPDDWRYVMLGFASIPEADIAPGIAALAEAWSI